QNNCQPTAHVFERLSHTHPTPINGHISDQNADRNRHTVDYDSFLQLVRQLLVQYNYFNPKQDLEVAWRIKDRQQSVCILLGGTSGCGKSTLASLLAHRIGVTTVLSTDNVRHLLRNFHPRETAPVLWASSYHAGESVHPTPDDELSAETQIVTGFEAQNEIVYDKLESIVRTFRARGECLIVEGVHLSIKHIRRLVLEHPNCIPFLIYISNQTKHTERFAIRAKYMTLEPRVNKYVRYFENIRVIQDYLCAEADQWLIPKVDNTNVDRSLATLHATVVNVLSRLHTTGRASVIDPDTGRLDILHEEYTKVHEDSWSSKQMLRKIRQNNPTRKRTAPASLGLTISPTSSSPSPPWRSNSHGSGRGLNVNTNANANGFGGGLMSPLALISPYLSIAGDPVGDPAGDPASELAYLDDVAWGSLAS
ncbi:P-loop containing nucleoside triphosphate hydrolase protein, partial [Jimgerdemannia flammicorona]